MGTNLQKHVNHSIIFTQLASRNPLPSEWQGRLPSFQARFCALANYKKYSGHCIFIFSPLARAISYSKYWKRPPHTTSDRARRGFSFGQLLKQKYDVTWNPGVPLQTKMEKMTVSLSTVKYILYIVKRRRVWIFDFFFYVKGPD